MPLNVSNWSSQSSCSLLVMARAVPVPDSGLRSLLPLEATGNSSCYGH
jgi:hypothetical protein